MISRKFQNFIHFGWATLMLPCQAQTLYPFGNPTAEEQQYIEYINRARANPPAEGARLAATTDPDVVSACNYFSVDLAMLQTEFNAIPAAPPLAPHASLTTAARGHSQWMLTTGTQEHNETNPANTPWDRITAAGYTWSNAGENIYAYAKTVWHGHAGFEVDWGGSLGGMQDPRGHRDTIHDPDLREIGVGVVMGTNSTVTPVAGPQLVTQDFGTRFSSPNLGTGVAYYDLNSNNFYDIGEGISGLTVNMSGTTTYCTTAAGGGWVVPAPSTSAATRTMTFSGLGVNQTTNIVFPLNKNAKADLKLAYSPPAITSSATAVAGSAHNLTFTAVGGATGYSWTRSTMTAAAAENCESTTNITTAISPAYTLLSTSFTQQGTGSFHLQNPTATSQLFQLNSLYYGGTSPSLSFQSCLRTSSANEHFKVQVKPEGETVWQDAYDQTGYGNSGESVFTLKTATLTGMAGKAFRVRFLLSFNGGSYYPSTGTNLGWYIDAINFTNVSTLGSSTTQSLTGTSGTFTPTAGTYLMSVAPLISGREFPASYQTLTATAAVITQPAITAHPASVTVGTGATATFNVVATGGSLSYQWYAGNSGVTSNPVSGATSSSFTTPALSSTTSYWVKVSNSAGNVNSNTATASVITPPSINTHPVPVTINSGSTATFTVAASGTSLAYQWYVGDSGDTSNPVSGATSNSLTTPALSATTSYWVRVSNAAASANSNTATATVVVPPAITTHPASVTINSGATTTFTVSASGTSPTYQWHAGNTGNTNNPISGATGSSFTTPALSVTNHYWVRVSNAAGTADSNAATATVVTPPVIVCQPVSTTVKKSTETFTLCVYATGPSLTYQWYNGTSGTTTSKINGATSNTYTTPLQSTSKTYWVRVTNAAGYVNSVTSTVSVSNNTVTRTFTKWASELETANSLAAGTISGINGDADKDGRSNLVEYAFGGLPLVGNDTAPGMPVFQTNATDHLLRYQKNTALTDITVSPQASSTLGIWKAPGETGAPTGFTDVLISTNGTIQTREARIPKTTAGNGFLRMKITQP